MKNNKLFHIILAHATALWLSLIIAYNGYKNITRPYLGAIPKSIKSDIKQSFVWIILSFALLLFLYLLRRREARSPGFLHYTGIFILHTFLINAFFYQKGGHLIAVMNSSEIIFALFLLIFYISRPYLKLIWEKLVACTGQQSYFPVKTSTPFILGFMLLLVICAFLLIFKAEKAAETLADIAYFSLIIGVGIELYQLIRYGERDARK